MNKSDVEADKRVLAGAALLDGRPSVVPSNWRERIDLESLDLGSEADCILGQLFDGYSQGRDRLNLEGYSCIDHGFSSGHHGVGGYVGSDALDRAWKKHLTTIPDRLGKVYKSMHGRYAKVVSKGEYEGIGVFYTLIGSSVSNSFEINLELPEYLVRAEAEMAKNWTEVPPLTIEKGDILFDEDGVFYLVESNDMVWQLTASGENTFDSFEYWTTDGGKRFKQSTNCRQEPMSQIID